MQMVGAWRGVGQCVSQKSRAHSPRVPVKLTDSVSFSTPVMKPVKTVPCDLPCASTLPQFLAP